MWSVRHVGSVDGKPLTARDRVQGIRTRGMGTGQTYRVIPEWCAMANLPTLDAVNAHPNDMAKMTWQIAKKLEQNSV